MSDPAKSVSEIEDVLSSIRRLVSENTASRPASPAAEMPKDEASAVADLPEAPTRERDAEKLVLTPSLRVTDPDDPWAPVPVQSNDEAEDTSLAHSGEAATWARDDKLSDWGAVNDTDKDVATDATASAAPIPDPGAANGAGATDAPDPAVKDLSELILLDSGAADGDVPFESETGDVNWPDTTADRALRDLAAVRGRSEHAATAEPSIRPDPLDKSRLVEAADAGGDTDDDAAGVAPGPAEVPTPDEADARDVKNAFEDEFAFDAVADDPWSDTSADLHDASGQPAAKEDVVDQEAETDAATRAEGKEEITRAPEFVPVFSRRADANRNLAAPSESATDTPDDLDTESPEAAEAVEEIETPQAIAQIEDVDLPAPDMEEPADRVDAAQAVDTDLDASEEDVEDLGEMPSPFTFPEDEEGLLDEETLREIVAEVVREELQGVLGQRITRNVRKMVRREIRLALAAEDLD